MRAGLLRALLTFVFPSLSQAAPAAPQRELPAVDLAPDEPVVPQPSISAGIDMGLCGVGTTRVFSNTRFCLAAISDLSWGRESYRDAGAGLFLRVGTAGFVDFRSSLGMAGLLPLNDWLGLTARAGPLLRIEHGPSLGAGAALGLAHRAVSHHSHYSLTHAIELSFEWTAPGSRDPRNWLIGIGVRLDGFWLSAPTLLFR